VKQEEKKKTVWSILDIAELGVMIATLEVGKVALEGLPNVEVVSFLIILYTMYFGQKTIVAIIAFVMLECMIKPINIWAVMYCYIWPLLSILTYLFRKYRSIWFMSILSGVYGLLFGALCSIVYLVLSGPQTALAWWIAGIPWDLVHGIGNFVIMLVLYRPLTKVFNRYCQQKKSAIG